jgi:hypothetical protein
MDVPPAAPETGFATGEFVVLEEAMSLTLLPPNPSPVGPLGCLTTPPLPPAPGPEVEARALSKLGGRVGTGGTPPSALSPLECPNKPLKFGVARLPAPEIVAYPSRMLPFEERELRRAEGACREERSGMDFLARRAAEGGLLEGDRGDGGGTPLVDVDK